MKLYLQILIACLFLNCSNKINNSELELATDYFNAQKEFDKSDLQKLLADNVEVYYGNDKGFENKKSLIETAGFSYGLNSQNDLINITQIDSNKVELTIAESDDLTKHLKIDNVTYKYTYEFKKNQIQKITLDTIDNPDFNYKQKEIEFNQKLNDLMKWVLDKHKDKAELMDKYNNDYKAGKILSKLIKERENVR
ncbi:hypothetical protein [Winogradskyella sp. SM1960]|uniref:hypothetical protein n=1 Tax=Winogradskyella sp. SM1960 TaxID=2865955 RepID=UPI001CD81989|nr:hypothetical protein [Winogradskyella sp. SM1960]